MPAGVKIYTTDESVYFAPQVEYFSVETENVLAEQRVILTFVRFTPNNGYDKGRVHTMPVARVSRVVTVTG